jgi:hypothetical protein
MPTRLQYIMATITWGRKINSRELYIRMNFQQVYLSGFCIARWSGIVTTLFADINVLLSSQLQWRCGTLQWGLAGSLYTITVYLNTQHTSGTIKARHPHRCFGWSILNCTLFLLHIILSQGTLCDKISPCKKFDTVFLTLTQHKLFSITIIWDVNQVVWHVGANVSDEVVISIFRAAVCSETPTPTHQTEHIRSHKNVRFQSSVTWVSSSKHFTAHAVMFTASNCLIL